MSGAWSCDARCAASTAVDRSSRADWLRVLDTVVRHAPGDARGSAVFLLDFEATPDSGGPVDKPPLDAAIAAEAARRIHAASPAWHRVLRGENDEFIVIAQGLVDGGTVLGTAARLVHAFTETLQHAELPAVEVSVGIALAPQQGASAPALLAAAEAGLRDAMATARRGRRQKNRG
jgi:predicted signal transduction protein with EAL and GGDEF domain